MIKGLSINMIERADGVSWEIGVNFENHEERDGPRYFIFLSDAFHFNKKPFYKAKFGLNLYKHTYHN